jgi:hypothetical protein
VITRLALLDHDRPESLSPAQVMHAVHALMLVRSGTKNHAGMVAQPLEQSAYRHRWTEACSGIPGRPKHDPAAAATRARTGHDNADFMAYIDKSMTFAGCYLRGSVRGLCHVPASARDEEQSQLPPWAASKGLETSDDGRRGRWSVAAGASIRMSPSCEAHSPAESRAFRLDAFSGGAGWGAGPSNAVG